MNMRHARVSFAAVVVAVFSCPAIGDAALAEFLGGSGYSARLSSNKNIRHQQLICDPAVGAGSATVLYDPSLVTLYSIFNYDNYAIDATATDVGNSSDTMVTAPSYFSHKATVTESGRVRVSWAPSAQTATGASVIGNAPNMTGFTTISGSHTNDGGTNVFVLEFAFLPMVDTSLASYTIRADPGGQGISNLDQPNQSFPLASSDFLTDSNGMVIHYDQITQAMLMGSLVPEPSGLALLAAGAIGSLARRRRRKE